MPSPAPPTKPNPSSAPPPPPHLPAPSLSPRSSPGMAADVVLDPPPANPCCAELKKRYVKLEEKRNALRQAVKLLEGQANKLQCENDALRKERDEERKRADLAQQAKEKESDMKSILEKEIHDLKSEIASLQENRNLKDQDRNHMLETHILQGEAEIKRLKEILQKEIKKGESEKKKAVEEKKKAADAWKQVKIEKSKAEEEKRIADVERKKAEDMRISLAKIKTEANEAREKLTEERLKAEIASNKVELEKQKASREKKRADSERTMAEKQRELVEIERKKLADEKNRTNCLSHQLEEERRKREELQKEIKAMVCTGQGLKSSSRSDKAKQVSSSNEDGMSANMKLMKTKLKLQRDQLKHAKRMAKLEKAEKQLLLQQLHLLKQDHIQFSHRLEMLINFSSYGMEGTDGLAKVDESLKQCAKKCVMRKHKCLCAEHAFNPKIETKTSCTTMEYMDTLVPCSCHLPQKCDGRSTKLISGICSDLESLVGESIRNRSQNSAIFSTTVTNSGTQLMGSQGRSAFAVATSTKLAKDNFQDSPSLNLTGEETEILPVAQQNKDGSSLHREMEYPCMNSMVCNGIEVTPNDSRCHGGKRKSEAILDAEDCGRCLKIDNNNSVMKHINSKSFVPSLCRSDDIYNLKGGKSLATELSDDLDTRNYKFCSKKKSRMGAKLGFQPSDHNENHNGVFEYEAGGHNETCFVSEAALPFREAQGPALTCRNKSSVVMSDEAAPVCLENIIPEDYMKLLDLDDATEEERYQAARERPLSPTLPELKSPSKGNSEDDCSSFMYGECGGRCDIEKEHRNLGNIVGKKVAMDEENVSSIDKGAPQTDIDWESRSSTKMKTANQVSSSKAKEFMHLNGAYRHEYCGLHRCCVVFSNTKDEQVISRIVSARNAIICDTFGDAEAGFSAAMVLHALAANVNLSAEEKACILFSFLLCKVSAVIPEDRAVHMIDELSSEPNLVTTEVDRVVSDEETRSLFLATCPLDIFFSLIQDFLIARKVIICEDTSNQSDIYTSGNIYYMENGNGTWTLRTAVVNQLVAGSVILASISTIHDCVDILWQTSFRLLHMCRDDSYWILTAVHVFASMCGVKFFSPTYHNLTITAIKSLVLLIERGQESGGGEKGPRFSLCMRCPFAEGEICVDMVTSLLLEELQSYIACTSRHQACTELVIPSHHTLPVCTSGADGYDAQCTQFDGSSKECHAFCSLHNFVLQVDHNVATGFCHFTDIISLLELFGYYMGWDYLHRKIIQQLFTLLGTSLSPSFSVPLLVLVGRLGRIGTEAGGPDQRDVEGLMFSLSAFLDMDRTRESGLPIQFAAVDALLNLLPLDFREIVEGTSNISLVASQVLHVEKIRQWFQQLDEEQKPVSLRLFQNSGMKG